MLPSFNWYLHRDSNQPWVTAKNVFTKEEIEKIIEIGQNPNYSSIETASVTQNGEAIENKEVRDCKLSFIRSDFRGAMWIFKKIQDAIHQINDQYYNFDLNYIETLQFTEYHVGGKYTKHVDTIYDHVGTRKMSFTIQLSSPYDYQGGDVAIHNSATPSSIPKDFGSMTAFPSYHLHEVTPIESGVRYALVGWVIGPKFK
jgi:predicted 2-oxoglutarate/Fe(II)-dependent dioxygenase YbiX